MNTWTESDLFHWDEKICRAAEDLGLDWHPIDYEIIDYQEMLGAMAYVGLPTHYRHWSYGKEYERTHTLYNMGQTGLPYEMIINSNPSIAYLMRENALDTHILTMAHCVGHSDFFKNNRMFVNTDPNNIIDTFKAAAKYVRKLIEDPSVGVDKVENILDAAHSIKYQVPRQPGIKYKTRDQIIAIEKKKMSENPKYNPNLNKIPLRPEYNLLKFVAEHSKHLKEWERNLILIVEESSKYFIPQALTKVMNEGWACLIKGNLINTSMGLLPIEDIVENKKTVDVYDGIEYKKVYNWFKNKGVKRIKIITEAGYELHGGNNHKIYTNNKWSPLSELAPGDEIEILTSESEPWTSGYCRLNYEPPQIVTKTQILKENSLDPRTYRKFELGKIVTNKRNALERCKIVEHKLLSRTSKCGASFGKRANAMDITLPPYLTEDLGYLLGMITGDGGFHSKNKNHQKTKCYITTGDYETVVKISEIIKKCFGYEPRVQPLQNKWSINIYSVILNHFLMSNFGFNSGKTSHTKKIPDLIFQSPKKVVVNFLRGYYDADGCAAKDGSVILSSTSKILIRQTQDLLLRFGIITKLNKQKNYNPQKHNTCYQLYLAGEHSRTFHNEITFGLQRKRRIQENWLSKKKWFKKQSNKTKIKKIVHDIGDTYDFSVEDTHRYRSGAFLNHNCTIHHKIVNELRLPDSLHLPFIKLHNQVVRPHLGTLNPYHLGFKLFEKIINEKGFEEAMMVREIHNDISFLRFYIDEEFMRENNYFSYSFKKDKKASTIDEISDKEGWEAVRDQMIQNIGLNRVPIVYVDEIEKNNILSLIHEHDGRDLDLTYANKVHRHIGTLWGDELRLFSIVENEIWEF
ncbi:MAG: hypothetical protein CMI54_03010 [Parcubacteria group bacterium]|nr:hypothetical protein [Parcubacteria group bacterium]|tara:strand:+ start:3901 stop:6471 length:2571 start_codon:yes stop_codon:yes gene_type:complete